MSDPRTSNETHQPCRDHSQIAATFYAGNGDYDRALAGHNEAIV